MITVGWRAGMCDRRGRDGGDKGMVSRIDRARAPNQSRGGGVSPARPPATLPPPPPPRVPVNRARDRFTLPPLLPPPPPPSPKAPCRRERRRRHPFHGRWVAGHRIVDGWRIAAATKGSSKSGIICFPPRDFVGVVWRASGKRADGLFPTAT